MSAENLLKKLPTIENADPRDIELGFPEENVLEGVPGVVRVNSTEYNGRSTPASDPGLASFRSERSTTSLLPKPTFIKPAPVPPQAKAIQPLAVKNVPLKKHTTPEPVRRFFSKAARELGLRGETVNTKVLMAHPLYKLYTEYLENPNPTTLKAIKNTVSALGYRNPIVGTLQDIVEQKVENSMYDPNAKRNAALQSLVKVLGASTVSEGGKRRTRKTRKQRKARKTRKTRHSRK
jgi:hypothetical protein